MAENNNAGKAKKASIKAISPTGISVNTTGRSQSKAITAAEAAARRKAAEEAALAAAQEEEEPWIVDAIVPKDCILITWEALQFWVRPGSMRSFKDLSVSSNVETEYEENGNVKYVKVKSEGRYQLKLTAILDKRLGETCPRATAIDMAERARTGHTGYVYFSNQNWKLLPPLMMLTGANAKNVIIGPDCDWMYCEVDLTLTQCSKYDGSTQTAPAPAPAPAPAASGGGGGGGGGSSGNQTYTVQIPGMSQLKKTAGSPLAAAVAACGANYTGYVTVNGTTYYLVKGQFGTAPAAATSSTTTATKAATTTQASTTNAAQWAKEINEKAVAAAKKNATAVTVVSTPAPAQTTNTSSSKTTATKTTATKTGVTYTKVTATPAAKSKVYGAIIAIG